MTFFDYVDKHPIISLAAMIIGAAVVILLVFVLISKGREITIGDFKLGKQSDLPDLLSKQARKKVKTEGARVVFAYSGENDPPVGLKNVRDDFACGKDIINIKASEGQFDPHFGASHTVVFQVPPSEYAPADCPLSRRIADYCRNNDKHCVLVAGQRINIDEADTAFDPRYVTTVNFYSKLRETLYMLLYFSPLNED